MSDTRGRTAALFYDAACPRCRRFARAVAPALARRRIDLRPLTAASAAERRGCLEAEWFAQMQFVAADGRRYGGADAVIELARWEWWLWPLHWAGQWAGVRYWLRRLYRELARHRPCDTGTCDAGTARRVAGGRPRHGPGAFFRMP
jgi:predicted DCC family thiol-disulfide oxidoreductase YuxK